MTYDKRDSSGAGDADDSVKKCAGHPPKQNELSKVLDEIKQRNLASFTSITDGGKAVRMSVSADVPALVNALRYAITRLGAKWELTEMQEVQSELAAILTQTK